jgi:hypothetical protein
VDNYEEKSEVGEQTSTDNTTTMMMTTNYYYYYIVFCTYTDGVVCIWDAKGEIGNNVNGTWRHDIRHGRELCGRLYK